MSPNIYHGVKLLPVGWRKPFARGFPFRDLLCHQLLAYALGGEVGDNPGGSEYGSPRFIYTRLLAMTPCSADAQ